MIQPLLALLLVLLAATAAILVLIYVLVPVLRGVGWLIANLFKGIGFLFLHVFEFIGGVLSDVVRFIGAIPALLVLLPLTLLNVAIGRWSAAGHFAASAKREFGVAGACLYRVALRRPLKLVFLHGLLEGVEQRVPEAMAAAPTRDKPSRRVGAFDGYEIVGSLRGGGSGAKLYIARPVDPKKAARLPERVVIKVFAMAEGSSLPQVIRESRALEAAKQLGLVLEHGMDEERFFYVMPYHDGDHLGVVAKQMHGVSGTNGLDHRRLDEALGYVRDLVATLATYHEGGLWHKDVKPDNVIVHHGRAHLVDLGLVTPLRSAMTLTTHGTEYFRDPEMVRQALRGVKVHDVDGAKFDVYAAGAVLYFLTEGTFPAHGGLSRFDKQQPEAVRWVIRRAMADYNKRYESAQAMLQDLDAIAASSDPYKIKPAELPSMGGEAAPAATPTPPLYNPNPEPGPAASPEPAAAFASHRPADAARPARVGIPVAAAVGTLSLSRPRLKVTNWWTGKYNVDDMGSAAAAASEIDQAVGAAVQSVDEELSEAHQVLREEFASMANTFKAIDNDVAEGRMSARKAATQQVKAARARAHAARRRVHAARRRRPAGGPRSRAEQQPTPFVVGLVMVTLAAITMVAMFAMSRRGSSAYYEPSVVLNVEDPSGFAEVFAPPAELQTTLPMLIINDHPSPKRADEVAIRLADTYADHGWVAFEPDFMVDAEVRTLIPGPASLDMSRVAADRLRDLLHAHQYGGVIYVGPSTDDPEAVSLSWIGMSDEYDTARVLKSINVHSASRR